MNNNGTKKKNKKGLFTETEYTLPIADFDGSIINGKANQTNPQDFQYYEIYEKIIELKTVTNQLTTQIKSINSNISSIRKKENRLLNRFGWTLIMANILLGILAAIIVLGYFQFFYPTLQKNINSEGTMELLKWIMFGILGALVTIWISVMKFANYIRKRDQINTSDH